MNSKKKISRLIVLLPFLFFQWAIIEWEAPRTDILLATGINIGFALMALWVVYE